MEIGDIYIDNSDWNKTKTPIICLITSLNSYKCLSHSNGSGLEVNLVGPIYGEIHYNFIINIEFIPENQRNAILTGLRSKDHKIREFTLDILKSYKNEKLVT